MFKNKVDPSQEGGLHLDEQLFDSRYATGFLVHLPYGPLPWMATVLNLVKLCFVRMCNPGYTYPCLPGSLGCCTQPLSVDIAATHCQTAPVQSVAENRPLVFMCYRIGFCNRKYTLNTFITTPIKYLF